MAKLKRTDATLLRESSKPKQKGRRFCFGDVHGRLDKLRALIKELRITKKDALYFVGDLIDRGNDSRGVLNYVRFLQKQCSVDVVMGNHEYLLLLAYYNLDYAKVWLEKYGLATLKSFNVSEPRHIPTQYIEYIASLPIMILSGNHIISHAGVNFDLPKPFDDTPENRMYALFNHKKCTPHQKYRQIIGHKHVSLAQCAQSAHTQNITLDTGCGSGDKPLTVYCLDTNEILQI